MDVRKPLFRGIVTISFALASLASARASAPTYLTLSPGESNVPEITLTLGQTQKLQFLVGGVASSNVTWTLTPNVGSITNNVYTAPSRLSQPEIVILIGQSGGQTALALFNLENVAGPAGVTPLTLSPSSASLTAGKTVQFAATGQGFSGVAWTISPPVGTISSFSGLYTAPATITAAQTITVTATNDSNTQQIGNATVSLVPTATVAPTVTPTPTVTGTPLLSPSSTSLTEGSSAQFTFTIGGVSQSSGKWSLVPAVGTIANGLYTAPASITTQTSVTLMATSATNSSVSASSSITLVPPKPATVPPANVAITVVPSTVSLTAGTSSSFTASVTGTTNTAVTWSMSPAVGTLNNGIYTAPATVSTLQTIILTATSLANSAKTAQASVVLTPVTYTMSVTPAQVTVAPAKTQQFTATVTASSGIGGSGPPTVTWTVSPAVGTISSSGLYTAPSTVATQQTVKVTATSTTLTASASVTLTASPATTTPTAPTPPPVTTTTTPTTILLPVEVMGPGGTTKSVTFNVASGSNLSGQQQLSLQVHGLKYQTEMSVQMNGGTWIPINNSTAALQGQASAFGGIGGGFATLWFTTPLPAASVVTGSNTLSFQFNGTDGNVSGFRVLSLNVLDVNGNQLIPASTFVQDDPANWTPPLTDSADIQAGQTLWTSGALVSGAGATIKAHCGDCHTVDGRDLKYFNYSNYSIEARSSFHGLTALQGQQIASYIRSLTTPAPATAAPWNPPYQPGPGLDSQPVTDWAAGAGLGAVLANDADMLQYLMPGGSTANLAATGFLNQRETPIAQQLPDWNRWLPTVHPLDAWGATFTSSALNQLYLSASALLVPNNATVYGAEAQQLIYWAPVDHGALTSQVEKTCPLSTTLCAQEVYSTSLWEMVKWWEMNQKFGLEGMPTAFFGPKSEVRAWITQAPFFASPNMLEIPVPSPAVGNGTVIAHKYFSQMWYQLQLILDDGGPAFQGGSPIDFPYSYGFVEAISNYSPGSPQPGEGALMIEWMTKALQLSQFDGTPANGSSGGGGWDFLANNPANLVQYPGAPTIWNSTSASQRITLINNYLTQWLSKVNSFTPQEFYTGGYATATDAVNAALGNGGTMADRVAFMIPQFLYWGASPTLVNEIVSWAQTVWPSHNWSLDLNASCGAIASGEVECSNASSGN